MTDRAPRRNAAGLLVVAGLLSVIAVVSVSWWALLLLVPTGVLFVAAVTGLVHEPQRAKDSGRRMDAR